MARVTMKRTLCIFVALSFVLLGAVAAQNSSEDHSSHSVHMHGDMNHDHGDMHKDMNHDHGDMHKDMAHDHIMHESPTTTDNVHDGHMHDHDSMHEETTDDRPSITESPDTSATGPGRPAAAENHNHGDHETHDDGRGAAGTDSSAGPGDHAHHGHHQGHGSIDPQKDDMMMLMDQAGSASNMLSKKDEDVPKKAQEQVESLRDDGHGGHGHGGHDGHDHGGHGNKTDGNGTTSGGGMHMHAMKMYFHVGVMETVLFEEWQIQNVAGMVGSVIGIVLLAMFYEGLKYFREFLFKQYVSSMQFSTVAVTGESGRVTQVHKVERHRMLSWAHTIQTCLHVVQMVISYFLMLIFMTYNVWLCLAVIMGAGLGYFVFGWKKATVVDITEHCH